MTEIGKLSVIDKKGEIDVEWNIKDCLHLPVSYMWYSSHKFPFKGNQWCMGIYPNGKSRDSDGYIDLYLIRMSSSGPPIDIEFSFSLKTLNGKKEFQTQKSGVFRMGTLHCINRFLSRSEYTRRKSDLLDSGLITVVCTLKNSYTVNFTQSANGSPSAKCSYCKETLDDEFISVHMKCTERPLQCPDCLDVVAMKSWLHGHECQEKRTEDGSNVSGLSKVCNHDKFLENLKQAFQKQENCDVVLRVKGQEFQAHKFILAARSPVFASTFRNDMKEKETGIVDIEDCDPSIFPDFLCFLYSDGVNSLSEENVFGLFTAADKYDIPDLRRMCLEFMKGNLSVQTFCETLVLSLQHNETELIHLATDFFIKNAEKILVTVKWQSFAAENPTQSNELFIKFVASDRCIKS